MDSNPGGQQNPVPPPYGGNPSVPPYGGDPSAPPYGSNPPPYGGPTDPFGGTLPPYSPPGQAPPFQGQGQGGVPPFGFPAPAQGRPRLDNRMMAIIGGGVAVVVLVIVLIVVLAGGGGSSPTATVNSFINDLVNNNGTALCQLVVPSLQSECTPSGVTGNSGHAQAVNQVIQGDEALVSVTGQYCSNGECSTLSDPTQGMPGNGVTFDEAFAAATAADAPLSPAALEQVNGTWYVVPASS